MFPNVRSGYCRGYCQATQARSPAIARSELYLGTLAPAGSRIGQLTAARRIAATERSTSSVVLVLADVSEADLVPQETATGEVPAVAYVVRVEKMVSGSEKR